MSGMTSAATKIGIQTGPKAEFLPKTLILLDFRSNPAQKASGKIILPEGETPLPKEFLPSPAPSQF
jgi:hypothetical protein